MQRLKSFSSFLFTSRAIFWAGEVPGYAKTPDNKKENWVKKDVSEARNQFYKALYSDRVKSGAQDALRNLKYDTAEKIKSAPRVIEKGDTLSKYLLETVCNKNQDLMKQALNNLQSQGYQVDFFPLGYTVEIDQNKLSIYKQEGDTKTYYRSVDGTQDVSGLKVFDIAEPAAVSSDIAPATPAEIATVAPEAKTSPVVTPDTTAGGVSPEATSTATPPVMGAEAAATAPAPVSGAEVIVPAPKPSTEAAAAVKDKEVGTTGSSIESEKRPQEAQIQELITKTDFGKEVKIENLTNGSYRVSEAGKNPYEFKITSTEYTSSDTSDGSTKVEKNAFIYEATWKDKVFRATFAIQGDGTIDVFESEGTDLTSPQSLKEIHEKIRDKITSIETDKAAATTVTAPTVPPVVDATKVEAPAGARITLEGKEKTPEIILQNLIYHTNFGTGVTPKNLGSGSYRITVPGQTPYEFKITHTKGTEYEMYDDSGYQTSFTIEDADKGIVKSAWGKSLPEIHADLTEYAEAMRAAEAGETEPEVAPAVPPVADATKVEAPAGAPITLEGKEKSPQSQIKELVAKTNFGSTTKISNVGSYYVINVPGKAAYIFSITPKDSDFEYKASIGEKVYSAKFKIEPDGSINVLESSGFDGLSNRSLEEIHIDIVDKLPSATETTPVDSSSVDKPPATPDTSSVGRPPVETSSVGRPPVETSSVGRPPVETASVGRPPAETD